MPLDQFWVAKSTQIALNMIPIKFGWKKMNTSLPTEPPKWAFLMASSATHDWPSYCRNSTNSTCKVLFYDWFEIHFDAWRFFPCISGRCLGSIWAVSGHYFLAPCGQWLLLEQQTPWSVGMYLKKGGISRYLEKVCRNMYYIFRESPFSPPLPSPHHPCNNCVTISLGSADDSATTSRPPTPLPLPFIVPLPLALPLWFSG